MMKALICVPRRLWLRRLLIIDLPQIGIELSLGVKLSLETLFAKTAVDWIPARVLLLKASHSAVAPFSWQRLCFGTTKVTASFPSRQKS
uniref:Uncharacterized protein n=1 Tax=Anguilla anguilla TaxID=7936 RepID=A0A0E9X9I2_ANGAN